jgi:hypothetical protein
MARRSWVYINKEFFFGFLPTKKAKNYPWQKNKKKKKKKPHIQKLII